MLKCKFKYTTVKNSPLNSLSMLHLRVPELLAVDHLISRLVYEADWVLCCELVQVTPGCPVGSAVSTKVWVGPSPICHISSLPELALCAIIQLLWLVKILTCSL